MRRTLPILLVPLLLTASRAAHAQNANVPLPPERIMQRLLEEPLDVATVRAARASGVSRVQQVLLRYPGDSLMLVKWARAADGGSAFNNEPRYEVAAYEIQKLFLDPIDYVVPPTVIRSVPVEWYRTWEETVRPTFGEAQSVVLAIQYWLFQVTNEDFYQPDRFKSDTLYARYLGNFNILTHLIQHKDENPGNYLISQVPEDPRVYSVDNGVSFRSELSDRGYAWQNLRVDRLPRATVERLRTITREDLDRMLAVIYQFEVRDGRLVAVPPGENLDDGRGVRRRDGVIQFGLTRREIEDVERRLRNMLERIDEGKIEIFE